MSWMAFYNLAILENAEEYGCTCHYVDNNFDTGALLKINTFKVNSQYETARGAL
jgi:methionyl-tRNA formyltransferase